LEDFFMRIILILVVVVAGLMGYIRFAPTRLDARHAPPMPSDVGDTTQVGGFQAVRKISVPTTEILQAVERQALATPRTRLLAGSAEEGTLTFVTRSALWGFPDYTTATVQGDLLMIAGHLRFGRSDMGVNKTRIESWLSALAPLTEPL
jgi:uncharacterized protein (DUF1499 family)